MHQVSASCQHDPMLGEELSCVMSLATAVKVLFSGSPDSSPSLGLDSVFPVKNSFSVLLY